MPKDGPLCKALHGVERRLHCPTSIHALSLDDALRIPLDHFRVGSHRLQVEAKHQRAHLDKIY
jgi:hypothetical protein